MSDRKHEVVALLLEGLSYTQITGELFVTRNTVASRPWSAYANLWGAPGPLVIASMNFMSMWTWWRRRCFT